eukprot:8216718-Lingulodinium_polyedra.AAC.1
MSWHTTSWPGQLALLCPGDPELTTQCLEELRQDKRALEKCCALGKHSLLLRNAALMSSLRARPMADLAGLVQEEGAPLPQEALSAASLLAKDLFRGFGQTKLVEDGNKE